MIKNAMVLSAGPAVMRPVTCLANRLLAALLAFSLPVIAVAATGAQAASHRYVVNATLLNVRIAPGFGEKVLWTARRDTVLESVARNRFWVRVRTLDGGQRKTGWVHSWYLAPANTAADTTDTVVPAASAAPEATAAPAPPPRAPLREATRADVRANARQPLREFLEEYALLEERYQSAGGRRLFSQITQDSDRTLVLVATSAWFRGTEMDRETDLHTLLRLWKTVNSGYPVFVSVRDSKGKTRQSAYR